MKRIFIDTSECKNVNEFYGVLLVAIGAPDWHGRNLDALWESITSDINDVTPPYSIELKIGVNPSPSVTALVVRIKSLFKEARERRHIEVEFNVS